MGRQRRRQKHSPCASLPPHRFSPRLKLVISSRSGGGGGGGGGQRDSSSLCTVCTCFVMTVARLKSFKLKSAEKNAGTAAVSKKLTTTGKRPHVSV
ncbi:unnamed protein product [Soboliphyme baturini]|uniref:Uncharacterized protein n=1 Tax=Soboliphyme baturini TaxID=241478 RepID=A0A183IHC3_9BILA|nr:unnamed protein product [Soboliphyme baturini]